MILYIYCANGLNPKIAIVHENEKTRQQRKQPQPMVTGTGGSNQVIYNYEKHATVIILVLDKLEFHHFTLQVQDIVRQFVYQNIYLRYKI